MQRAALGQHAPKQSVVSYVWIRDDSAKKYTNKICRDNVSHPLYIPMLAFGVAKGTA